MAGLAGLDVGSDIALANAVDREISRPGLTHQTFIEHATTGFEARQDDVATNLLPIDASDPTSGTAGCEATAIRIERLS